jgi:hypothetical protein
MSFTGDYITTSFKMQVLEGVHDLRPVDGHVFKMALYGPTATLNADTTAYTTDGEIERLGYTAGGITLLNYGASSYGNVAFASFRDPQWDNSNVSARGALIYNSTPRHTYTLPSVCVIDFGDEMSIALGTFKVLLPPWDQDNAIIRFL